MKSKIVKFRGNPHPAVRHGNFPIVVILPVVRIERYRGEPSRGRKRRRNARGVA
jgi:hypothetical protein